MVDKRKSRKKAIIKRRMFILFCTFVLALVLAIIVFVAVSVLKKDNEVETPDSSNKENISAQEPQEEKPAEEPKEEEFVQLGGQALSADFSNLLLVNNDNPLSEDYDYEGNLTTIPQKYIKGSLTQIDNRVWPYLKAMLDDAREQGVDMGVWSPYRSYNTQKMLFNNQVQRELSKGLSQADAENAAATVVARPGTSEHHTGLALDINCANDSFEQSEAYAWLCENAADYGFIMRYSAEKQSLTGVIHESWHWRFVGIKPAKEIKKKEMCLEEYVEYLEGQGEFEGESE